MQNQIVIEPGDDAKLVQIIKKVPTTLGYWNRITIKDGSKYNKNEILKLILNALYPHKVLPVKYQQEKNDTFFLFRNGLSVLQPLAHKGLKVKLYDESDSMVLLGVTIKYCPLKDDDIDPLKTIDKCIKSRVQTTEKVVDLRNFHNDPLFKDIYVQMSVAQCSSAICDAISRHLSRPQVLLLSYNELDRLDILEQYRKISHCLTCLDLSHNNITWSGFEKIPFINIKELWLEDNPLYADFLNSSAELVKEVKRVMPSILKLDGVELGRTVPGDIVNLKTCFMNPAYDTFVDHFLHHYFSIFESNRDLLKRMYHPESSFSITVNHVESQTTSGCQRINSYMKFNRNLLSISDIKRSYELIHYGPNDIIEILKTFPNVRFDPFSFQVDVPITHIGKTDMVQINTCGIFRDLDSESSALFAFDRTFILVPWKLDQDEWKISNDMWAITNATSSMAKSSFRYAKTPVQSDFAILLDPQMKKKEQLTKIFGKLTHMNAAWVQKFLGESCWNIELALQAFTDQYKLNQLPPEAFVAKEK